MFHSFYLLHRAVFLLAGAIILLFLLYRLLQAAVGYWRCRGWPETAGVILQSAIVSRRKLGNKHSSYPNVVYQYTVLHAQYHSDRIHPGPDVGGWFATRKVARYPVGKTVTVYYNPDQPSESVLEKQAWLDPVLWVLAAMAGFFFFRVVF